MITRKLKHLNILHSVMWNFVHLIKKRSFWIFKSIVLIVTANLMLTRLLIQEEKWRIGNAPRKGIWLMFKEYATISVNAFTFTLSCHTNICLPIKWSETETIDLYFVLLMTQNEHQHERNVAHSHFIAFFYFGFGSCRIRWIKRIHLIAHR